MKVIRNMIIAAFILTSINVFAQNNNNSMTVEQYLESLMAINDTSVLKIDGFSFPNPSVSNMVKWVNQSTIDWETEMKKYSFSDRYIEDNCVGYGSGALLKNDCVFGIKKCPGNILRVLWSDLSGNGITKLDTLINQIEPFYFQRGENNSSIYFFVYGDNGYEITVLRNNSLELVYIKKHFLKE